MNGPTLPRTWIHYKITPYICTHMLLKHLPRTPRRLSRLLGRFHISTVEFSHPVEVLRVPPLLSFMPEAWGLSRLIMQSTLAPSVSCPLAELLLMTSHRYPSVPSHAGKKELMLANDLATSCISRRFQMSHMHMLRVKIDLHTNDRRHPLGLFKAHKTRYTNAPPNFVGNTIFLLTDLIVSIASHQWRGAIFWPPTLCDLLGRCASCDWNIWPCKPSSTCENFRFQYLILPPSYSIFGNIKRDLLHSSATAFDTNTQPTDGSEAALPCFFGIPRGYRAPLCMCTYGYWIWLQNLLIRVVASGDARACIDNMAPP
jgi:hypothetical protein